eukprot:CAMPEP_0172712788 /NCGR_PEP_ID=MMETSP1074-20121228/61302_1 /TAXON_ID=2916 /ORGANISM="Ceratium fusus, Strain PA161109" /LENGTH=222 /DNA_ID=CAMNT_0013536765 /DNA_START=58 /DNA_END=723 /DNA_ORIENTATION=-
MHASFSQRAEGLDAHTSSQHARPLLARPRYHDMLRETIYAASSKDAERVAKHAVTRLQQDAEHAEWAEARFRRQRSMAAMWRDMQEVFDDARGRKRRNPEAAAAALQRFSQVAAGPQAQTSGEAPIAAVAACAATPLAMQRKAFASAVYEELVAEGLASLGPAEEHASGRQKPSGALHRCVSEPACRGGHGAKAQLCHQAGTRGLPRGYVPPVPTERGTMMW